MGSKFFPCLSFILFLVLSSECGLGITTSEADGQGNIRCPERERQALIKLKAGLQSKHNSRLDSWGSKGHEYDCCKWSGVECSNTSGHVTGLDLSDSYDGCKIDSSLHELQQLSYLNLSMNYHNDCYIPAFFGNFTKLVELDLSDSRFGGRIPPELGNLSMLEYLDLSGNYLHIKIPHHLGNLSKLQYLYLGYTHAHADDLEWVSHLRCLRHLDLQLVDLSKAVDWVQTIMNLPRLTRLYLQYSAFPDVASPNPAPENVSSSLSFIDLSYTEVTSSVFQWIFNLSGLSEIHLEVNSLRGTIPDAFGNMPSLIYLDLSNNELEGDIPTSFGCTSLRYLVLSNNRLNGDLSNSIRQLHKLRYLDLTSNSLHGIISENHLNNFSSLEQLFLDSNLLTLRISPQWAPPFQLLTIDLSSCNLGPQFPSWLKTQTSWYFLDISSNQISGTMPDWIWNLSSKALHLDISYNEIRGAVPSKLFSQNPSVYIDLSSNHFEGRIPSFNHQISFINLSKNKFSGSLSSLCQFEGEVFYTLDLSENSLSGEVPNCWKKKAFRNLDNINLSNNNLSGRIPSSICSSRGSWLSVLHLRNNNFSGELPSSLSNCSQLDVLDVANNMISGNIPEWIGGRLRGLSTLILRTNRFSGALPSRLCWLQEIQIIDVSHNDISGRIPRCLGNLTALRYNRVGVFEGYDIPIGLRINDTVVSEPPFEPAHEVVYQAILVWKGSEYEYKSQRLAIRIVDFSSNNLQGEIPEEFGSFTELGQLNLSNNNLSGHIPHRIGEMRMLEVLDLSSNHLSGQIPQSISNLSFLDNLNLSYNSLSGLIPMGTQIQSFSAASFMGNPGLCGDPLPNKCHQEEAPPPSSNFGGHEEEKDGFISKGFYISMGVGFVIGFWGVLGPLLFRNFWSSTYFRFLNNATDWIYVRYVLVIAGIQRRLAP